MWVLVAWRSRQRHEGTTSALLLTQAPTWAGLSPAELPRRADVVQSVTSDDERGKRQPALAATGHRLALGPQPPSPRVRGLPDTRLGRLLRRRRQALLDAVAAAGARNLRVFGSVARGEDGPDSDVDLLVDVPEDTGMFALLALEGTLERILEAKVDLATPADLKPRVRDAALADAIAL